MVSLEIEEKDEGVMRLLYAAVKSLPQGPHDRFRMRMDGKHVIITIVADAGAVGHPAEYVDKHPNA